MSFFRGRSLSVPSNPTEAQGKKTRSRRASDPHDTRKTFLHAWFQKRSKTEAEAADEPTTPSSTEANNVKAHGSRNGDSEVALTRKDLHMLFVGAPYFLLENGKYGQSYPQAIFPWSDHDLIVQNLGDAEPLPHSSFMLCTLHAHLPVPDGWNRARGAKRAIFDVGVFEVPNMLALNGKEPGSIGFRHFLELPVADSARYTGPELPRPHPDLRHLLTMPAIEAFESIEHHANDPYAQCRDGTVHDRKRMLYEGPSAWKRIGVRDPGIEILVDRLERLRSLRHDLLYEHVEKTLLDAEPLHTLHFSLYANFLYYPPRHMLEAREDPCSLKAQIRFLATALAAPGAWFDFSLGEWRLRVGQILWEAPPHRDGDYLHPGECEDAQKKAWVHHGLERKWLLLQMVLAGELLLRLDAMIRVGIIDSGICLADMHEFHQLRNGKVNWDLIVVRRFFDSFGFSSSDGSRGSAISQGPDGKHHRSLKDVFTRRRSSAMAIETESAWGCRLTPFLVDRQLHGLFVFAETIGWPGIDALKARLQSVGQDLDGRPVCDAPPSDAAVRLSRVEMYSRRPSRRLVLLQDGRSGRVGWITRSWLSGFVAPGECISALLLAAVLENDPEALATLGPLANLHGGFSYQGHSWWSKQCVVGRVLASLREARECMGWIRSDVLPVSAATSQPLAGTWFEVPVKDAPSTCSKKPRIKQGHQISDRSTPLGEGDISREAFWLPVDPPALGGSVDLDGLTLAAGADPATHQATLSFRLGATRVSWPLAHNVQFITSQDCRPPRGRSSKSHDPDRLPGHPLHTCYSYRQLPVSALPGTAAPRRLQPRGQEERQRSHDEVLVVDARGDATRESFARAWCAAVGTHAVIGRVGRSCLACCIREAQAVEVGVVIRVGGVG